MEGGTDGQNFCFEGPFSDMNGGFPGDFCLDDDGNSSNALSNSIVFPSLIAGNYSFTELGVDEWDVEDIDCNALDWDSTGNSVIVRLRPGENVVCIFVNEEDEDDDDDENGDEGDEGDEEEVTQPPIIRETTIVVPPQVIVVQAPAQVVTQPTAVSPAAAPPSATQPAPQQQQVSQVAGVTSGPLPAALPRSGSGGYVSGAADVVQFLGILFLMTGLTLGATSVLAAKTTRE